MVSPSRSIRLPVTLTHCFVAVVSFFFVATCQTPPVDRQQENANTEGDPVPIIFDTDIGPDYDDVGATAVIHALADSGEARILATVASSSYPKVGAVLSVLNTYFGRPDLPIGVPKGPAVSDGDRQHWSDTITARYPHAITSNDQVPDPVEIYRRVLASQPDTSVTVVTVGFLTNLVNLLESAPDEYSDLDGTALVASKVKRLVSMAGKFPAGREFNVYKDVAASQRVFDHWPRPVLFSGFEIGEPVRTGLPLINNDQIQDSPVKDVYRIGIPLAPSDAGGRMSWDQTAVLVAVKGPAPFYTIRPGRIIIADDGSNTWDTAATDQAYLLQETPLPEVTAYIDRLMQHQPPP